LSLTRFYLMAIPRSPPESTCPSVSLPDFCRSNRSFPQSRMDGLLVSPNFWRPRESLAVLQRGSTTGLSQFVINPRSHIPSSRRFLFKESFPLPSSSFFFSPGGHVLSCGDRSYGPWSPSCFGTFRLSCGDPLYQRLGIKSGHWRPVLQVPVLFFFLTYSSSPTSLFMST